jgi:hypothetical protein
VSVAYSSRTRVFTTTEDGIIDAELPVRSAELRTTGDPVTVIYRVDASGDRARGIQIGDTIVVQLPGNTSTRRAEVTGLMVSCAVDDLLSVQLDAVDIDLPLARVMDAQRARARADRPPATPPPVPDPPAALGRRRIKL